MRPYFAVLAAAVLLLVGAPPAFASNDGLTELARIQTGLNHVSDGIVGNELYLGLDLTARNGFGKRPLMPATQFDQPRSIRLLLARGAERQVPILLMTTRRLRGSGVWSGVATMRLPSPNPAASRRFRSIRWRLTR